MAHGLGMEATHHMDTEIHRWQAHHRDIYSCHGTVIRSTFVRRGFCEKGRAVHSTGITLKGRQGQILLWRAGFWDMGGSLSGAVCPCFVNTSGKYQLRKGECCLVQLSQHAVLQPWVPGPTAVPLNRAQLPSIGFAGDLWDALRERLTWVA